MVVFHGILAGLIGGILMGVVSGVFYRLGIFKSSILVIDGAFVTRFMKRGVDKMSTYLFGVPVHLLTSTTFGVIYMLGTYILKWDPLSAWILWPYIAILWVSMLFVALPIAGQGLLGRKGSRFAWAEQLALHLVYGVGLWFSLTLT